jgi:hypothetical membrane protein
MKCLIEGLISLTKGSHVLNRLKLCGVCGIFAPIVAFTGITVSFVLTISKGDSIFALSDLGVKQGVAAVLFNYSLIISGLLTLVLALGLLLFPSGKILGKIGAFTLILDALALTAIGVFPENVEPTHFYASVTFFVLFPISLFFISTALLQMSQVNLGLFTFLAATVAAFVWAIPHGKTIAIPETLAALSVSTWSIVLGVRLLKEASRSSN